MLCSILLLYTFKTQANQWLFKKGIFEGQVYRMCGSFYEFEFLNRTFLIIFLSVLTFQNSKSKDPFSKKGYMAVRNPILVCNDVAHVTNEFTKVWMNSKRRAKHFANNNSQHQQLGNICKAIWNQNHWLQCIPKMRLTARKKHVQIKNKKV